MLQRLFAALEDFPSHSHSPPDLNYISRLLRNASKDSTTPRSLKVAREVIVQGIPTVIRKTKSIFLALALAQSAIQWGISWGYLDISERPSVTLDKVMLELWSEQEDVEGRTQENLEIWQTFRSKALEWPSDVDLAVLNGPLPTWNPSTTRTGSSKLDRLLSVFGIDRVCAFCTSVHFVFLTSMY